MSQPIIVPLDGSRGGEHALPVARSVARLLHAPLHLVHVHESKQPVSQHGIPIPDAALDNYTRAGEQAYLTALTRRLHSPHQPPVSAALLSGTPSVALTDYATDIQAQLIIMTTHGTGALLNGWVGNVARSLMQAAPLPLLFVRPAPEIPAFDRISAFRRILLPLDGSRLAEQVLDLPLIRNPVDASYTLLHILPTGEQEPSATQAANQYLEQIAHPMRRQGRHVTTQVIQAAAPEIAILIAARQHKSDLIAMTTYGREASHALALSSIADSVARNTMLPLLLHRPTFTDSQASFIPFASQAA